MRRAGPKKLVVCIGNGGYPASLETRKIYISIQDQAAEKHGILRVIDESGEGYLYPKNFFRPIVLPQASKRVFWPRSDVVMADPVDALLHDMLEWIAKEERSYAEVMEAWRTSCPRLPVWEEANARGLVTREVRNGSAIVTVTAKGTAFLEDRRVTA